MRTALVVLCLVVLCLWPLSAEAGGKGGHPGGHPGTGNGHGGGHSGGHGNGHEGHGIGHGGGHDGGHGGHLGHNPGGHSSEHHPGYSRSSVSNSFYSTTDNTRQLGGSWGYTTLDNDLANHLSPSSVDFLNRVDNHINNKF